MLNINSEKFKIMSISKLKDRFKRYAIDVTKLVRGLNFNQVNKVYSNQIIRSSSSSAANYRAACRAKSQADFIYKMKIVEEETDETLFFLEMIEEFNPEKKSEIDVLKKEGAELLSITVSSITTARKGKG